MIDLEAFRVLISRQFLRPEDFTTILAGNREKDLVKIHKYGRVREMFRDFEESPVRRRNLGLAMATTLACCIGRSGNDFGRNLFPTKTRVFVFVIFLKCHMPYTIHMYT